MHKDETDPAWRDNPRRFLLIGRPQIGKTGVFLWLAWLLWQQYNTASAADAALAETTVDVDELEEFDEVDDETSLGTGGNKFPTRDVVASQRFQHPPTEVGGYGDLKDPGMWKHYLGRYEQDGTRPLPKPPPYKVGEGFKKRAEASPAPSLSNAAAVPNGEPPAVGSKRPLEGAETPPKEQLSARWLSRGPKQPITSQQWQEMPDQQRQTLLQRRGSEPQPIEVAMGDLPDRMLHGLQPKVRELATAADGNVGTLRLTSASIARDWEACTGSPGLSHRLKRFDSTDEDVLASRLCVPIMTPSGGRASEGLLDLSATMVDVHGSPKEYVQIVCVKTKEADWYLCNWPEHDFFIMPPWADELGVGAHRFCLKRLAEAICPKERRLCLMIDDNVLNWVGITLVDDTERLFGDPIPTGRTAKCRKRNRPMWEAMSYLQDKAFDDLQQFAMLGFQRLGNPKYHNNLKAPFARSHVYKCYLLNLDRLEGRDFDGAVWVMEDVDFNKRLVCDCFPPAHGSEGQLCRASLKTPPERCACWASDGGLRQSELLCKIRRFGFYGKKLKGGASGTAEDGPERKQPKVLPTPVPLAPVPDFAVWLRELPSLGKLTQGEMDALVVQFEEADMGDFLDGFRKNGHDALVQSLQNTFKVAPAARAYKIANAIQEYHEEPPDQKRQRLTSESD